MITFERQDQLHVSSIAIQLAWCKQQCPGCYINAAEEKLDDPQETSANQLALSLLLDRPGHEVHTDELILSFPGGLDAVTRPWVTNLLEQARLSPLKYITLAFQKATDVAAALGRLEPLNRRGLLRKVHLTVSDTNPVSLRSVYDELGCSDVFPHRASFNVFFDYIDSPQPKTHCIIHKPVSCLTDVHDPYTYKDIPGVSIDRCVIHVVEQTPCPAGTSTFHILPSGHVTGCPYRALDDRYDLRESVSSLRGLKASLLSIRESPDFLHYCAASPSGVLLPD